MYLRLAFLMSFFVALDVALATQSSETALLTIHLDQSKIESPYLGRIDSDVTVDVVRTVNTPGLVSVKIPFISFRWYCRDWKHQNGSLEKRRCMEWAQGWRENGSYFDLNFKGAHALSAGEEEVYTILLKRRTTNEWDAQVRKVKSSYKEKFRKTYWTGTIVVKSAE
jgi:hypothetical protein